MGAYVEDVYHEYGKDWKANLFYSHLLSIPMFAAFAPTLNAQFARLHSSHSFQIPANLAVILPSSFHKLLASTSQHVIYLLANAITQLLCITGVNILSANTSAVTVTIVLNIRKLVSFMLSIWIFGNQMSGLMKVGAVMVFGAGALYGYETTYRIPQKKKKKRCKLSGCCGNVEKLHAGSATGNVNWRLCCQYGERKKGLWRPACSVQGVCRELRRNAAFDANQSAEAGEP